MLRVTCLTVGLIAAAALSLPAQSHGRGADFGNPAWCDQDRDGRRDRSACRILDETVRASGTIDVDARQNGGIRVRGWDRDDVHVRVRMSPGTGPKHARARSSIACDSRGQEGGFVPLRIAATTAGRRVSSCRCRSARA